MLQLLGNLWNLAYLHDVGSPVAAGGGAQRPQVTRQPAAPGATQEGIGSTQETAGTTTEGPGATLEASDATDAAQPTDVAQVSTPVARDQRVPTGDNKVDVSVLTSPDNNDNPFPDVTKLLQAGKLDKASAVLRQAITTATPRQQYHLYFMLADVALAAGDVKALNDAYDHVLKLGDPDEADPIENLRQKDLAEIAGKSSDTPPAADPGPATPPNPVSPTAPPATDASPAVAQPSAPSAPVAPVVHSGEDGQPYMLENRVNEHKEDVLENVSHLMNLARLAQETTTADELASLSAQAANSYEQAVESFQKAKGTVETLQHMAEDYPDSLKVKHSLDRAHQHLTEADQARQTAEKTLNDMGQAMTNRQNTAATQPGAATQPAAQPLTPTAPVVTVPADVTPAAPVKHVSHPAGPGKKHHTKQPHGSKPAAQPPADPPPSVTNQPAAAAAIPTLTNGEPTQEELDWANTINQRFQSNDTTLTDDEKRAYNNIARRNNELLQARQAAATQAEALAAAAKTAPPPPAAPEKGHTVSNILNWIKHPFHHGDAATAAKPKAAPAAAPPAAPAVEVAPPVQLTGPAAAAAAQHEQAYEALAPRADDVQQRRSALMRREMAVTALGITQSRADELTRQRSALDQDRAKLMEDAHAADQALFGNLSALKLVKDANDLNQFITARARRIRNAIFGN